MARSEVTPRWPEPFWVVSVQVRRQVSPWFFGGG